MKLLNYNWKLPFKSDKSEILTLKYMKFNTIVQSTTTILHSTNVTNRSRIECLLISIYTIPYHITNI